MYQKNQWPAASWPDDTPILTLSSLEQAFLIQAFLIPICDAFRHKKTQ